MTETGEPYAAARRAVVTEYRAAGARSRLRARAARSGCLARSTTSPKLRPVRQVISLLTWRFTWLTGRRSDYVKVSGMAAPRRLKASRWVLVGSVSIGTVTWVPANRTWLRGKVARCWSRCAAGRLRSSRGGGRACPRSRTS